MPWCDACSAYHAPTALVDGACPVCGGAVEAHAPQTESEGQIVGASAPWHFWLVVVLLALYLGWRVVVLIIWVFD